MGPEMQNSSQPGGTRVALIIIILAVLAALYFYFAPANPSLPDNQATGGSEVSGNNFNFAPLTDNEKAALDFPKSGSSAEMVLAHTGAVHKAAVASESVVIGAECRTSPAVLSLQKGQKINFRNVDNRAHVIAFDGTHSLSIPANGTASMSLDFGEVEHVYGYGCESSSSPVGVVLIVK